MILSEKAAYVKGLMDGLNIDDSTKEGKVLLAIYDLVSEMANTVDEIDADVDDIVEFCNVLDEDLQTVEDYLLDEDDDDDDDCDCDCDCCDDDCDCDCCGDEFYDITCPSCDEEFCVDEETLLDGGVECPNCGEHLEFDLEDCCEDDCDCGCCCDDED